MEQQIKRFVPGPPVETQVKEWLKENPQVRIINMWTFMMHDYYDGSAPPMLCNQWQEAWVLYHEVVA